MTKYRIEGNLGTYDFMSTAIIAAEKAKAIGLLAPGWRVVPVSDTDVTGKTSNFDRDLIVDMLRETHRILDNSILSATVETATELRKLQTDISELIEFLKKEEM